MEGIPQEKQEWSNIKSADEIISLLRAGKSQDQLMIADAVDKQNKKDGKISISLFRIAIGALGHKVPKIPEAEEFLRENNF